MNVKTVSILNVSVILYLILSRLHDNIVTFKVEPNDRGLNATEVSKRIGKIINSFVSDSINVCMKYL